MNRTYLILVGALLFLFNSNLWAQHQLTETSHHLLGVDVAGYKIGLPFSKTETELAWKSYANSFGRGEKMQEHQTYETKFEEETYAENILLYVEITGNSKAATIWAGIDPQGIPKDVYPELQNKLSSYIYDFNIKMRKDALQKEIEDSERAASFLSKSYEEIKREERKNLRNQEKNHQKIKEYELELKQMRTDSASYDKTLETLHIKLDSMYIEIEKVKKMVDMYRVKLEEIK